MAQLSNMLKEWYGKALEELQTYQNKKGNNPNAFLIDFRNSADALEFTKLVCIARGKPGQELVDLNKQKKEKKRVGSDDEEMKDESAEGKKEEEKQIKDQKDILTDKSRVGKIVTIKGEGFNLEEIRGSVRIALKLAGDRTMNLKIDETPNGLGD